MWRGKRYYRCCNTYSLNKGLFLTTVTNNSTSQIPLPLEFLCHFKATWTTQDHKSTTLSRASMNSPLPNNFSLWRPWIVAMWTIGAILKAGQGICSWNTLKQFFHVTECWQAWAALPLLLRLIYLHGLSAKTESEYTLLIFSARKNNTVLGIQTQNYFHSFICLQFKIYPPNYSNN